MPLLIQVTNQVPQHVSSYTDGLLITSCIANKCSRIKVLTVKRCVLLAFGKRFLIFVTSLDARSDALQSNAAIAICSYTSHTA